jgi:hypothetical protein
MIGGFVQGDRRLVKAGASVAENVIGLFCKLMNSDQNATVEPE